MAPLRVGSAALRCQSALGIWGSEVAFSKSSNLPLAAAPTDYSKCFSSSDDPEPEVTVLQPTVKIPAGSRAPPPPDDRKRFSPVVPLPFFYLLMALNYFMELPLPASVAIPDGAVRLCLHKAADQHGQRDRTSSPLLKPDGGRSSEAVTLHELQTRS